MIYKLAELFCGAGGLALGAEMARVTSNGEVFSCQHVWVNDFNEWACKTFEHNFGNNCIIKHGDVRNVDLKTVPEINGLAFGFPCNDYSVVGKRRGLSGNFGPLYSYGVEILNLREPDFFLAENVSGLSSANDGKAFRKILDELQNAGPGYTLTPHLYKFEEYGVPQTRHRILIVGIRRSLNIKYKVPVPTHKSNPITVKDALIGAERVGCNNERTKHKSNVIEMLQNIPPGGNAWSKSIPEHLRLKVNGFKASQIYRRLDPNAPSYTITGSGGGGTHGYHWNEPRALTNRERARIQTFPDNFEFIGPKEQVRKQIGMAVPPLAAKVVFEHLIKSLLRIDYTSVPEKWEVAEEPNLFSNLV